MNLKKITNRVKIKDDWSTELVGKQKFTYGELENAIEEMFDNVFNDPDNLPNYTYDIRNGYSLQSDDNPKGDLYHDWGKYNIGFNMESIETTLENIPDEIAWGDMEVYFNDKEEGYAESDEHGIFFEDGKITKVY